MEGIPIVALLLLLITAGYCLMVVGFALPLLRKQKPGVLAQEFPVVSVIIAARNEEKSIGACLESIFRQDYPNDRFEVIVSDDHSGDRTADMVRDFREQHPGFSLTLVTADPADKPGKKPAIERAINIAIGEWILTTDADTQRGSGWLKAMTGPLAGSGARMILGPVKLEGESLFQRIQRLEFLGIMGLTAGSAFSGNPVMCNGANLLYSRNGFHETGGFTGNERYPSGDDQFLLSSFGKRYGRNAIAFAFHPEAVVTTEAGRTLRGFLGQRMRWVSKSKGYRDPVVMITGLLTWLLHAGILALLSAGVRHPFLLGTGAVCFGMKLVADLFAVLPMAAFFKAGKDLWLYIPAQVFQVFYVTVTGIAGLVMPYRWKGRLIRA